MYFAYDSVNNLLYLFLQLRCTYNWEYYFGSTKSQLQLTVYNFGQCFSVQNILHFMKTFMRFILLYKSIIKSFSKFCEATKNLQQVISLFTVNYLLYQEFNRTTDASQHITSFQALYKILFQCRAIFCAF